MYLFQVGYAAHYAERWNKTCLKATEEDIQGILFCYRCYCAYLWFDVSRGLLVKVYCDKKEFLCSIKAV